MFNATEITEPQVNKVGFYASKLQGHNLTGFNPSLSILGTNITAEDSFGDDIPDGYPASDLVDTNRDTRTHVDMSADSAETFYFQSPTDFDMEIDFMIMDGTSLRDSFGAPLERVLEVWTNPDDAPFLSSSDVITPYRVHAGILGTTQPYLSFDGIDDYVVVANDANLNFGTSSDFSFGARFSTTDNTDGILIDKGDGGNGRYAIFLNANGTIGARVEDSVSPININSTSIVNDGNEHTAMITVNRGSTTGLNLYIDGILDATPVDISGLGDIDDTDPMAFGIRADNLTSTVFKGEIKEVIIYNRVLAPKEVEQMAKGYAQPRPLVIGDNSSGNSTGDWTISGTGSVSGGYDSGDSGHETTFRVEAGTTNERIELTQSVLPTVAGRQYQITFDYKYISMYTFGNDLTVQLGGLAGTKLDVTRATGVWYSYSDKITVLDSTTPMRIYINSTSSGGSSNEMLLDNIYVTDLSTMTTFPLQVDKWGKTPNLVTNGEDWTGAIGTTMPPTGWSSFGSGTATYLIRDNAGVANMDDKTLEFRTVGAEKVLKQTILTPGTKYRLRFSYRNSEGTASTYVYMGTTSNKLNLTHTQITGDGILVNMEFVANGTEMGFVLQDGGTLQLDHLAVDEAGAVGHWKSTGLNYNNDGAGEVQSWYDSSDNLLHGTVTGATGINVARETSSSPSTDMILYEWDLGFKTKYWFFTINDTLGATAQETDVFFSQLSFGKKFVPSVNPDINFGISSEWGIAGSTTRSGARLTNKLSGKRKNWVLNWSNISGDTLAEFQALWDTCEVGPNFSNYPLYMSVNEGEKDQVFEFVRIMGIPQVTALTFDQYALTMELSSEVQYNLR